MRGAIGFDRPTDKQQAQHEAEHQLFLSGQRIHQVTIAGLGGPRNLLFLAALPLRARQTAC